MAAIELNKRTNIIDYNIGVTDYFVLNPFNLDGSIGIDLMSVILELQEPWNGNTFFFYVPQISQLPTLNFQVKFTNYIFDGLGYIMVAAGNDYDAWENGGLYYDGVMTWIPQSLQVLPSSTSGWWLVEQPDTTSPSLAARSLDSSSQSFVGPETFKELTAKFK